MTLVQREGAVGAWSSRLHGNVQRSTCRWQVQQQTILLIALQQVGSHLCPRTRTGWPGNRTRSRSTAFNRVGQWGEDRTHVARGTKTVKVPATAGWCCMDLDKSLDRLPWCCACRVHRRARGQPKRSKRLKAISPVSSTSTMCGLYCSMQLWAALLGMHIPTPRGCVRY